MQKTKLGVSVAVLGAAVYFAGLFSGYTITIIMAGYILLMEENVWLKKSAVKSVALMIAFSALSVLLGLIPDAIGVIGNVVGIFGGSFRISVLTNTFYMLINALNLLEKILFLILGLKALNQGTIKVPVIDKLVDKCME